MMDRLRRQWFQLCEHRRMNELLICRNWMNEIREFVLVDSHIRLFRLVILQQIEEFDQENSCDRIQQLFQSDLLAFQAQ